MSDYSYSYGGGDSSRIVCIIVAILVIGGGALALFHFEVLGDLLGTGNSTRSSML